MKTGIANTGDWNLAECMLPTRFLNYTEKDFEKIDVISKETTLKDNNLCNFCQRITTCKVPKCNIKKAAIDYKMVIMANIYKRKMNEMKAMAEAAEEQLQKIKKSTEEKLEKIEKQTEV